VKYLAEELVKRGHEVHVLHSLDAYRIKRKTLPEKAEPDGVYTHVVKSRLNFSSYITYVLGSCSSITQKFKDLVKEIKPEVIHHHNISLLGYDILKKQGDYLNLYTAHDYWLICQQNNLLKNGLEICEDSSCFSCVLRSGKPPQLWRLREGFQKVVKNIDVLIAPSEYLCKKISKNFKINNIVTIPNFVPEPPIMIEPLVLSNFFLYSGVLEKHKGILNLIDLFRRFGEIDATLVITGEGGLKEEIKRFIKKSKIEGRILLLGWVKRNLLYRLLKASNALIIPSIWPENAPLVALEALSVGTPVIASNVGGLPEIVGKVDEKLIFNNMMDLKNLILNFSRDKFPSSKIIEVYEKNFSPRAYIDRYISLIQKM
jgi:glycosyltransferase involved in cell wall biosynthesis